MKNATYLSINFNFESLISLIEKVKKDFIQSQWKPTISNFAKVIILLIEILRHVLHEVLRKWVGTKCWWCCWYCDLDGDVHVP